MLINFLTKQIFFTPFTHSIILFLQIFLRMFAEVSSSTSLCYKQH